MRDILVSLRGHWTFLLILVYLIQGVLIDYSHIKLILLIVLLIRIFYLKKKECWLFLLLGVLSILASSIWQNKNLNNTYPGLSDLDQEIIVYVDPIKLKTSNTYSSIQAQVIQPYPGQKVELISFDENNLTLNQAEYWHLEGQFQEASSARNFYLFDYKEYLKEQGIHYQYEIKSIKRIPARNLKAKLTNLRYQILKPCLTRADNEWVSLHNKIILNQSSQSYRALRFDLVNLGIVHLFSLSGLHIHFIRRVLKYLLIRSGHITNEWAEGFVLVVLSFYSLLIEAPIGVVRVVVGMYVKKFFARKIPLTQLDQLAFVGVLLLFINPKYSISLGFLLSFMLTYLVNFYKQGQANNSKKLKLEISLVCFVFSSPILAQVNHFVDLSHIVMGLVFSILVEKLIMPLMLATTILIYQPLIPVDWLLVKAEKIYQLLLTLITKLSQVSLTRLYTGYLSDLVVFILLGIGIVWLVKLKKMGPKANLWLVVYMVFIYIRPYLNPYDRVTMLDVGQGDSVLYQKAHTDKAWLTDTGGRVVFGAGGGVGLDPDHASKVLIPSLRALGVNKIEGMIITHPDIDHIGNLVPLSQEIEIKTIYLSEYCLDSKVWQEFSPQLDQNTKIKIIKNGQITSLAEKRLELFTVPQPPGDYKEASNDSSIITYYNLAGLKILNLGDLSKEGEGRLINMVSDLSVDIIKLGHHGSNTSSSKTFLSQLNPSLALISAGEKNRYNHPHPQVLKTLDDLQIPNLGTYANGAVQIQKGLGKTKVRHALKVSQ